MINFKTYNACISYLYNLEREGIKYDLKNIKKILKHINHPERKFKSVHIAGTNGKGSVASIINSVLMESGFKTGLYTSPHLIDFRERILINGKMISKKYVMDFTNRLYRLFEEIKPSFFEATTAMAFEYFANQNSDYAIIESGLGGRLDSTNVLKPEVSVVTGISIDHTEYLGNTISKIAREKAGIIKKNVPCVIGKVERDIKKIFENKCKEKGCEIIDSDKCWNVSIVKYKEGIMELEIREFAKKKNEIDIEFPLIGKYQTANIKTSLASLDLLGKVNGITFEEENLKSGFKNVIANSKFFGRFQLISSKPKVIIDVSHNEEGIKNIRDNLKFYKYKNLFIIFGMMKDKEYIKCLNELVKLNAVIILTKPEYKRAEEPEVLYKSNKNKEKVFIASSIKSAYRNARKMAGKNDLILVTGSFFLVSDFLKIQSIHL